jgi:hypothetical protein
MGKDASASLMGFDRMITRSKLTLTKICMLIVVGLVVLLRLVYCEDGLQKGGKGCQRNGSMLVVMMVTRRLI